MINGSAVGNKKNEKSLIFLVIYFSSIIWVVYSVLAFPFIPAVSMFTYIVIMGTVVWLFTCFISGGVGQLVLSRSNLVYALTLSVFSLLTVSSYEPVMQVMARFTPWIDADLLNTWHQDTAFHVSLIRSILNWGYPSVALDGHPLATYHLLSHYIDAIFILICGIDPYDGYGFMVYTKALMLIITCVSFISSLSNSKNFTLWGTIIFIPPFIGTWHVIGSHALWATSFLLVMVSMKAYGILLKEKTSNFDYLFMTLVSMLLCAGKISTGFSFICIYYSALFIKDYKSIRFYVSSVMLIAYLICYQRFFNYSYGVSSEIIFSAVNFSSFIDFVTQDFKYKNSYIVFSFIYIGIYLLEKSTIAMQMLFSTLATIFTLYVVTRIFSGFNQNDTYYFMQGYFSVMIFIAFIMCCNSYNSYITKHIDKKETFKRNIAILTVLFALFVTSFFFLPKSAVQKISYNKVKSMLTHMISGPYKTISGISGQKYNLFTSPTSEQYFELRERGTINDINSQMKKYMSDHKIKTSGAALFISGDIANEMFISKLEGGRKKFYAMNLYAMTGVQMIHSVYDKKDGYGFKNYDKYSVMTDSIDYAAECKRLKSYVIFELKLNDAPYVVSHICEQR